MDRATVKPPDPRRPQKVSWGVWWVTYRWPVLILSAFGLFMGSAIYLQSTLVVGTELNVVNWEIRQFSFRRDPVTGLQMTGIKHTAPAYALWSSGQTVATLDTAIAVHLKGYATASERWDLVSIAETASPSLGRASIFVHLVNIKTPAGDKRWADWSNAHPGRAKIFWPAIQDLVVLDAYAKLPPFFQLAASKQSDEDFAKELPQAVLEALTDHAQALANAGLHAAAEEAARVGLSYGESDILQQLLK
jgi:hypothetical protein